MSKFIKIVLICAMVSQLMGCAAAVVGGALASKKYMDHSNKKEIENSSKEPKSKISEPAAKTIPAVSEVSDNSGQVSSKEGGSVGYVDTPADYSGVIFEGEASTKEDACLAANISANFEPKYQGEFPCSCARTTLWLCKVYPDKK